MHADKWCCGENKWTSFKPPANTDPDFVEDDSSLIVPEHPLFGSCTP
jgi:hypothetical protein